MACKVQRFSGCLLNPQSNKANSPEVINVIVFLESGNNVCENFALTDRTEIYTDWANHYLAKSGHKRLIKDLQTDVTDGVLLAEIIQVVGIVGGNVYTVYSHELTVDPAHLVRRYGNVFPRFIYKQSRPFTCSGPAFPSTGGNLTPHNADETGAARWCRNSRTEGEKKRPDRMWHLFSYLNILHSRGQITDRANEKIDDINGCPKSRSQMRLEHPANTTTTTHTNIVMLFVDSRLSDISFCFCVDEL
ncbi:hypothetical protein PAMA_000785 [Pampus argenteus]